MSGVSLNNKTTRGLEGSHPVSPPIAVENASRPELAAPSTVLEIEDYGPRLLLLNETGDWAAEIGKMNG